MATRCAWSHPCYAVPTETRQMLEYCAEHAKKVDANREAMFKPKK